jgi:succinyl-diaminopimelate desuccinylase
VSSDTGIPSPKHPALTYALRGIVALEVIVRGPDRDLHSGIFGGSVDNPAMVLCQMLAQLRNAKGKIQVPGFYDDVLKLSAFERKQVARLPFNERAECRFLGFRRCSASGYTCAEQRSPADLRINGLTSGYRAMAQDDHSVVGPAKLTFRLVANQDPPRLFAR